jgi:dTDP-4-amino-4,6-dideoxygalactose transaminase
MLTMGPKVGELERRSRPPAGRLAVVVSSGTAALHLRCWLCASARRRGDRACLHVPATANAVELCGARAVLVDVDPDTFNLDPARVVDALTVRTRAVLVVHLFGRPADLEALQTAVPQ